MHSRGRDPQGPPDHVRSLAQLRARTQDCLLDDVGRLPGRGMRPARAITKVLAATSPVDPLGSRLSGTANDERGCCDRHPGGDQVAHTLTLTNRQDRICMKIHKSPPSVATRTSRTLGGLNDALRCQQRVWELQLGDYSKNVSSCGFRRGAHAARAHPVGSRDDLVPRTGRDQHRVAGDDIARLAVDLEHAAAGGEEVDLLRPRVVVGCVP